MLLSRTIALRGPACSAAMPASASGERPRPADGRDGVVAGRERLPPGGPLLGRLRVDGGAVDPGVSCVVHLAGRRLRPGTGAGPLCPLAPFAVVGPRRAPVVPDQSVAADLEAARLREPDRLAARNRVALRRSLAQRRDRKRLLRVGEVHVGATDQVPGVIDMVSVSEVVEAPHAVLSRPAALPRPSWPRSATTPDVAGGEGPADTRSVPPNRSGAVIGRGKEAGAASGACREIWHVQELHEEAHGPGGIDLV